MAQPNPSTRSLNSSLRTELIKGTSKRRTDPEKRRRLDVRLPRFDFLHHPRIKIYRLCELFLSYPPRFSFTLKVRAESREKFLISFSFPSGWHAILWRLFALTTTPLSGASDRMKTFATPVFLRRLGPDPHANGAQTEAAVGCPDILELADGDFAVIGSDITEASHGLLPPTVSCGPDERVIRIPRKTLVLARSDIPSA